ncbi:hypothetical protein BD770DRAFT_432864 [Pilaira anomala]|nr:hypothetical protein BD770DRAFT_432864 [Pilaira anomala]
MFNGRQCGFGYPKPPAERAQFQDDVCEYERTVADEKSKCYYTQYEPPDMDRRMLRYDILELDEDDDNIFNISRLQKYEKRQVGGELTFPQFCCSYEQQTIIQSRPRISQTFADARGIRSWREYYIYLVDQNAIPVRDPNVSSLNNVSDIERYVFKLAPTGVSAHNIGGQTLHRFFGLTLQQAKQESLWKSAIYNHSNRYNLVDPIGQRDPIFLEILEFVRVSKFNTRVANFIISRTVSKNELPLNCLRLYTERKYAEKD